MYWALKGADGKPIPLISTSILNRSFTVSGFCQKYRNRAPRNRLYGNGYKKLPRPHPKSMTLPLPPKRFNRFTFVKDCMIECGGIGKEQAPFYRRCVIHNVHFGNSDPKPTRWDEDW
jgi:hypothetical protein